MFPLHQGNELSFKISSTAGQDPQECIMGGDQQEMMGQYAYEHASLEGCSNTTSPNTSRRNAPRPRKSEYCDNNNNDNDDNDNDDDAGKKKMKKKMVHRDVERQRRQEMAALYASLRTLLPLEYIKGKRSISDHINEAVRYIKHMQKNIQELDVRRDELQQQLSHLGIEAPDTADSSRNPSNDDWINISACWAGLEIVICNVEQGHLFPLSRVLGVLLEEGLNVVSCISTRVNERLFHTIQVEVGDPNAVDLSELRQKLMGAVHFK